eukprot:1379638-Amphidinium_carterae.1
MSLCLSISDHILLLVILSHLPQNTSALFGTSFAVILNNGCNEPYNGVTFAALSLHFIVYSGSGHLKESVGRHRQESCTLPGQRPKRATEVPEQHPPGRLQCIFTIGFKGENKDPFSWLRTVYS